MAEWEISCEGRGHDRYGRAICLCRAAGLDLGVAMVSAGMA
jgi:endonuclease YncB( thermonuclease family)